MGRMKEEFIKMAEDRFQESSLFELMGFVKPEKYEEEVVEVVRGNYKTTVTIRFDREGLLYLMLLRVKRIRKPTILIRELTRLPF